MGGFNCAKPYFVPWKWDVVRRPRLSPISSCTEKSSEPVGVTSHLWICVLICGGSSDL